jgi:hypothetical protein
MQDALAGERLGLEPSGIAREAGGGHGGKVDVGQCNGVFAGIDILGSPLISPVFKCPPPGWLPTGLMVERSGRSRRAACPPRRNQHRTAPALHRGGRSGPRRSETSRTAAMCVLLRGRDGSCPVHDPYPVNPHVQDQDPPSSHSDHQKRPCPRQDPCCLPQLPRFAAAPPRRAGHSHLGRAAGPALSDRR